MAKITQAEGAAASTPASGYSSAYVKTDGLWYSKDDAGTEYRMSFPYSEAISWTPVFTGTGTAGTFTYAANGQVGQYSRFGNMVFFSGALVISAISVAPTGNMRITGLPLTSVNVTSVIGAISFSIISNINYSASALSLIGRILPNTSYIELFEVFDNVATVEYPAGNFTNANAALAFVGHYFV